MADDSALIEPMTREEVAIRVYIAVKMEMHKLRWAPWRKHMTAEEVLKGHGVEEFCKDVTERLVGIKPPIFFRNTSTLGHSADGSGIGKA